MPIVESHEHQHAATSTAIDVVRRFYDCYASGDLQTMKDEVLAPDVVWWIPGRHPLAGPKRGAEEVVAFFAQLAKANMEAEVIFLSGDDTHADDVHAGGVPPTRRAST